MRRHQSRTSGSGLLMVSCHPVSSGIQSKTPKLETHRLGRKTIKGGILSSMLMKVRWNFSDAIYQRGSRDYNDGLSACWSTTLVQTQPLNYWVDCYDIQ